MWKRKTKSEKLEWLSPDSIEPNPYASRQRFSGESLNALAASIAKNGVLCPLTVRRSGGVYELILGERRLRAARLLDLDKCRAAWWRFPAGRARK